MQGLKGLSVFDTSGIQDKSKKGKRSGSYDDGDSSLRQKINPQRSYSRRGKSRYQRSSSPFGPKLRLRENNSSPFGPKLSLRGRRSLEWGRKRQTKNYQNQDAAKKNENYNNNGTGAKSGAAGNTPIISGYKSYVDMLNKQMED